MWLHVGCCSVPGPLQSVQRAQIWGVILLLQAAAAVRIGMDNLDVGRQVHRIIQSLAPCKPIELLSDGDLLYLVKTMLDKRRPGRTKVTKVKEHAPGDMVVFGAGQSLGQGW